MVTDSIQLANFGYAFPWHNYVYHSHNWFPPASRVYLFKLCYSSDKRQPPTRGHFIGGFIDYRCRVCDFRIAWVESEWRFCCDACRQICRTTLIMGSAEVSIDNFPVSLLPPVLLPLLHCDTFISMKRHPRQTANCYHNPREREGGGGGGNCECRKKAT